LLKRGIAYPCFCEHEKGKRKVNKDTEEIEQSSACGGRCRKLSNEDVIRKIKQGETYAIRIKSDIEELRVSKFNDEVYG
jgi:glutamyl/glutaminyl-tRNA synthetase